MIYTCIADRVILQCQGDQEYYYKSLHFFAILLNQKGGKQKAGDHR